MTDAAVTPVSILGANSFADLTSSAGGKRIQFDDGVTQTVTGDFNVQGSGPANYIELHSTTPGNIWTLDLTGAATVTVDWVAPQDSDIPGTTLVSPANFRDDGNNDVYDDIDPGDGGAFGNDIGRWVLGQTFTWTDAGAFQVGAPKATGIGDGTPGNDGIPGRDDDAIIPNGSSFVVNAGANRRINDIDIGADATVDIGVHDFEVTGTYTSAGTFILEGTQTVTPANFGLARIPGTVEYTGPGGTVTGLVPAMTTRR